MAATWPTGLIVDRTAPQLRSLRPLPWAHPDRDALPAQDYLTIHANLLA